MGPTSSEDAVPLESYHNIYEVVFVDPSGMLNLTAAMSSIDFLRVSFHGSVEILQSRNTLFLMVLCFIYGHKYIFVAKSR